MARPKGTGLNDDAALRLIAELLVDEKAHNPWQAARIAQRGVRGRGSNDSVRRRLYGKFNKMMFRTVSGERVTYGELLELGIRHHRDNVQKFGADYKRLFEAADRAGREHNQHLRLRALIEADSELMEVVEHVKRHPDELLDYLPDMLEYGRKFFVE